MQVEMSVRAVVGDIAATAAPAGEVPVDLVIATTTAAKSRNAKSAFASK